MDLRRRPVPEGWTWAGSPGNTLYARDVAGDLSGSSYIINNPTPVPDGAGGQAWQFDSDRRWASAVSTWPNRGRSRSVRPTARTADQVLLSSAAGALKLQQLRHRRGRPHPLRQGRPLTSATLPLDRWTRPTWVATEGHTTLYADGSVGAIDASIPLPLRSVGTEKASLRGDLDDLTTWDDALSPRGPWPASGDPAGPVPRAPAPSAQRGDLLPVPAHGPRVAVRLGRRSNSRTYSWART